MYRNPTTPTSIAGMGTLAATGLEPAWWLIAAAFMAVVAGIFLVRKKRMSSIDSEPTSPREYQS